MIGSTYVPNYGTVLNYGYLNANGRPNAVAFSAGGVFVNETGGSVAGQATGAAFYAKASNNSLTSLYNFGSLSGDRAVQFLSDGSVTNEAGGAIIGADLGVFWRDATGTLLNDGGIAATGGPVTLAVDFYNGGTLTNQAAGVITGLNDGIAILADTGMVTNAGRVVGTPIVGVELVSGGFVGNSGVIGGGINGILVQGAPATVDNSGLIYVLNGLSKTVSSDDGAAVESDSGGSVTNEARATISGGGKGVYLRGDDGSVTNLTGGTVQGYQYGIMITGAAGTSNNQGLVSSVADFYVPEGRGVYLTAGGTITNATDGTISGYAAGILANGAATTIDNQGRIQATAASALGPDDDPNGIGIWLDFTGTIVNETGGAISGYYVGINVDGAAPTIVNGGTILGGAFTNSQGV